MALQWGVGRRRTLDTTWFEPNSCKGRARDIVSTHAPTSILRQRRSTPVRALIKYFFQGLLFVLPIAATVYLVYLLFNTVDQIATVPEQWIGGRVPGLGVLMVLVGVTGIGYLASHFFTRKLARLVDRAFHRLPGVKLVYGSVRDLVGAVVGEKQSFDRAVLMRLGHDHDVCVVGFVTRDDVAFLGLSDHVAVYVPQSYNFAANLIVVPRERVTPLDITASEAMTFVVSGGVSGPRSACVSMSSVSMSNVRVR